MPTTYTVAAYAPAEIEAEYPNLWATIGKYFNDLGEERKAVIGSLVISTCGTCHNDASSCRCWDDE